MDIIKKNKLFGVERERPLRWTRQDKQQEWQDLAM